MLRNDQQFHWLNDGYTCFDDFLASLSSRKRKNLKKERSLALDNGIEVDQLTGSDLKEEHWDAFFNFYQDTGSRKWGTPYLTREFFSLIGERMAEHTLLIMCKRNGQYIAGALNFIGGETLFGRNWGCLEDHRFLHFETCYYQAIDFAIERGLKRVEAGAQGAHKLARGYLPTKTYSLHWVAEPNFRSAIEDYLNEERQYIDREIDEMAQRAPFKDTSKGD
jgi:predicted N-acyltransferase